MAKFSNICTLVGSADFKSDGSEYLKVYSADKPFVEPQFCELFSVDSSKPPVIMISARGAAGKSAVAEKLSQVSGYPLWKLEEGKAVGADALRLRLSEYSRCVNPYMEWPSVSGFCVIVDSLDEAHARVSGTSWSEFIDSLIEASRAGVRLVLLGREKTLDDIWYSFDEAQIPCHRIEVSHFDEVARLDYIDLMVETRGSLAGGRETPHYSEARDAVMAALTASLSDAEIDTFAGYAPVLDAVVAVLAEERNLSTLPQKFNLASSDGRRPYQELRRLIENLLSREQWKLQPLASDLGLRGDWCYSPEEQIDWVCNFLVETDEPDLSFIEKVEDRVKYRDQVKRFVEMHPFVHNGRWSSTVFAAYVAASRFESIPGPALREIARGSGLFFEFFAAADAPELVSEQVLGALQWSMAAGESGESQSSVVIHDSEDNEGFYTATLGVERASSVSEVRLEVMGGSEGTLAVSGPIDSISISTNGYVAVQTDLDSCEVGSDVFIEARGLSIPGVSVEFYRKSSGSGMGSDDSDSVTFIATKEFSAPYVFSRWPAPGVLEVYVAEDVVLAYPWVEYRHDYEEENTHDPSGRVERFLKLLMTLTRNHGHRGPRGCFDKKLEGRQSIARDEFNKVLSILESRDLISRRGSLIFTRPELESHRFSGRAIDGQRQLGDKETLAFWSPILDEMRSVIS